MKAFFAPWRMAYIKGGAKEDQGCVFCEAFKKGVGPDSLIVGSGQTCGVFLNKYPYNNGHCMVIPKRHTAAFDELSNEEFDELHKFLKLTYNILKVSYEAHGANVGMNLGHVAGAGIIDHLHYHLVPRWNGDTNFMPIIAETKVISESLQQTYERLRPLFAKQGF